MIVETTRTNGLCTAGENATRFVPRRYTGQAMGMVYRHGSQGTDTEAHLGVSPVVNLPTILYRLVALGHPLISAHNGGETWGNNTGVSRVVDDVAYLQGAMGAPAGKVIVFGASMGGIVAMNYTRAHPDKVACLVLIRPVCNAALINAAYGGAYNNTTDGPNHNPVLFANQLAGIPTQIWYASNDAIITPSTVLAVVAGIGAGATATDTAPGGHTDAADAHTT
jgi:hypothetical protein